MWRGRVPREAFALGLLLGGLVTGLLLTLLSAFAGLLPRPVGLAVVAVVLALSLTQALGLHDVRLPHRAQVVPQEAVLGQSSSSGALQFGFEMGTGMRTHMPSNLPYVALACALLLGPWWAGLLAGAAFALGRLVMAAGRWVHEDWDIAWTGGYRRNIVLLNVAAVAGAAVVALGGR